MGTNFYARRIPTKEEIDNLKTLIDTNKWDDILYETHNLYDSFSQDYNGKFIGRVYHLGKRSAGWKFLWNPNIYIIRNGHMEYKDKGNGVTSGSYIKDPDTYYYVYPLSKEGIWNFINEPDIQISDEYGRIYDKEEFFEMAINWTTWTDEYGNIKEGLDGKAYEKEEKSSWHPSINDKYCKALKICGFNIEFPYSDFYSDGLRFATSNEFS